MDNNKSTVTEVVDNKTMDTQIKVGWTRVSIKNVPARIGIISIIGVIILLLIFIFFFSENGVTRIP